MRAVSLGYFIFLSDEGSPARHLYFIVPPGISSSFFLLHLAITQPVKKALMPIFQKIFTL
jgi:hypothetical protein